ncbi:hypothetical protein BX661DRAFT_169559 [Kickxella alabastrina]|uniref:uncharacterized protein n=1 Tax=Kickxella alabastrina TaxID=61397 RepID=UPI00221E874A|nr:uncharacterized protein BX661DRAFT_169559 [Kickxella alabastrina]KAI7833038.1 hypothetical protein BX661DRAFT_169559 [Kickxella alabastrina]
MSFNSQNNLNAGRSHEGHRSQVTPIPINVSGSQRSGSSNSFKNDDRNHQYQGGSSIGGGSFMGDTSGINAPPNSFAVPSSMASHVIPNNININMSNSSRIPIGAGVSASYRYSQGTNAPPNSLAVPSSMAGQIIPSGMSIDDSNGGCLPIGADISGSYKFSQGINAPPNSYAVPSSLASQMIPNSASLTARLGGGFNPPPNTPAQVSKLHQIMGGIDGGLGTHHSQEYGIGQVPSGSFIDRRIHAFERVGEADEDDMDQDMDNHSPNSISPGSFHHSGSHHMSNKGPDDIFEMEQ